MLKSTKSGADAATPMNLLHSRPSTIAARNTRPTQHAAKATSDKKIALKKKVEEPPAGKRGGKRASTPTRDG
jgi:hypothetical protein